ncbi:Protein of unknown function DUF3987) [uncultured Caudovirales phage]|uniref:DNA primase/polymerase bifunctional N-terminal domain-containing protein n=1 Tax=uncultured Caudovirales phage TaxID=2100421 RepID=A0A6J5KMR8_9CAUD|nr:Protein of unknown function DUF3987) [uncultured Caudovirales phage]
MSTTPPPNIDTSTQSPFERRAYAYIERGYSVIPIAPGTKRPGSWSQEHGWRGMHDWERYFGRMPTELELEHWYTWPGAGLGLLLGKQSGVVALDRDYDAPGTDALERIIPYTPVKKKGAKGYTAFFRYNNERSCSFNINEARVLDVLAEGRQTLMPGTIHPDGHTYIYLTEDLLEDYDPADLPVLPDDFLDQVAKVLAPYQTDQDKKYQKKTIALPDNDAKIDTDMSISAQYYHDLNQQALIRLDEWVTKIVPNTKPERDGFRTMATWRGAKNHNVGIHHRGVFDFGGNYGMTPIDLVMYANGLPFPKAAEALRACLALNEPEPITFSPKGETPTPTPPVPLAAMTLPWAQPKAPPPPVMLPPTTSIEPARALPAFIANPPGILGDITRWIAATAPKSQHELALAAAVALCSVVMGRTYRSQYGNFTSLYLVMVAKSTEGKEHPQACVEKALTKADLGDLIGGSGYTSAGAVYSALLKHPAHVVTIDEMGKLLKMSRAKGQANTEAAIDKLIEAFGRQDGILRPPTYSTMTLSKAQASGTERIVHNPAITLLGATTPATFYENLTDDLVKDGFLGRCIVVESRQPRQLTRFVDRTDPPARVIDWCKAVHVSAVKGGNLSDVPMSEMPANVVALPFSEACRAMMDAFEVELNDAKDANEAEGLDVLLGRTLEKALKLAMIVAKAMDIKAREVMPEHLQWAIEYVRYYDVALTRAVRRERIASQTDGDIKRAINFIRNARKYKDDKRYGRVCEAGGLPHSKLLKLMAMPAKQFKDLMDTAVEAGTLTRSETHVALSTFGYAGEVYFMGEVD